MHRFVSHVPSEKKRIRALLSVLGLSALVLSSCLSAASGGGRLPSADGVEGHYATFGFNYRAVTDTNGLFAGARSSGVYRDPYQDVALKFGPAALVFFPTEGFFDDCLFGSTTYTALRGGGEGTLSLLVCDLGEPGPSSGDGLFIFICTGPYAGYVNEGTVAMGNIQGRDTNPSGPPPTGVPFCII